MTQKAKVLLFLLVLSGIRTGYGQNSPDSVRNLRVETRDGNIFIGSVMADDSATLVLNTETYGEIRIPVALIKSRSEIKEIIQVHDRIWLPNPQSGRYFWSPNGYGLEKGISYYQNIWLLYNQFSFGLADNFSVGAGMLPLFLFAGSPTPVWLVPKISIPVVRDKFNIGTGAFLGTILDEDSGIFGLLYGTATIGSRDKNLSIGLAYGFAEDNWMEKPVINLSGMIRVSPKSYLITENYILQLEDERFVLISLGARSIVRNVGIDYSLWIPRHPDMDEFLAIPFLGVTVPLGKNRQR